MQDVLEVIASALLASWAETLAILISIAALVTSMRATRRDNDWRSDEARRAQASLVSAWLEPAVNGGSPSHVVLYNGSPHPATRVTAYLRATNDVAHEMHPSARAEPIGTGSGSNARWLTTIPVGVLPPHPSPQEALRVPVGYNPIAGRTNMAGRDPDPSGMVTIQDLWDVIPREPRVDVAFTDNAGRRWRRYTENLVLERDALPLTPPPRRGRWRWLG